MFYPNSEERPAVGQQRTNADADGALDVEEYVSSERTSLLTPSDLNKLKRRRNRNRKAGDTHTAQKKAQTKKGGSRLVRNNHIKNICGSNTRTCLMDSVAAILPPNISRELVCASISSAMPEEGDTSISDIKNAMEEYGLMLEQVNSRFIKKGGAAFYILQERDCRLVISLSLTNKEGRTMSHFVAWDGKEIFDRPHTNRVSRIKDRANHEASKLAFGKLYPRTEFKAWQITSVFQLVVCK